MGVDEGNQLFREVMEGVERCILASSNYSVEIK